MTIDQITRKFTYKGNNLPDIPGLSERDVLKVYMGQYPELVNSTVTYVGLKGTVQEYTFETHTGTKG